MKKLVRAFALVKNYVQLRKKKWIRLYVSLERSAQEELYYYMRFAGLSRWLY